MTDAAKRAARVGQKKPGPKVELADAQPPAFSDEALAQRFARRFADELRYVAAWNRWHAWNDTRWQSDTTLATFDRARAICRAAAAEADKPGTQTRVASKKTVAAVEQLSKADRRIAATVDQWDSDLDIFNMEEP